MVHVSSRGARMVRLLFALFWLSTSGQSLDAVVQHCETLCASSAISSNRTVHMWTLQCPGDHRQQRALVAALVGAVVGEQ